MNMALFSMNFYTLLYYFALYSFGGWCAEVLYAFYQDHRFVNRGFLYGPFCPMYGAGALILIVILKPAHNNLLLFFILAFVLISVLEYFTGFLLEKAFKTTWWDYSEDFLNIKGRICLSFSILWGVGSVIFIKFVHPFINGKIKFIHTKGGIIVLNIVFLYFIVDFILTMVSIMKLNTLLSQIYDVYTEFKNKLDSIKDSKSEVIESYTDIFKELKNRYEIIFEKIQHNYSRLTNAFPSFTVERVERIKIEIKEKVKIITKKQDKN